jgi:hypothetical protein
MYLARAFHLDLISLAEPQGRVKFQSANGIFELYVNLGHSDIGFSAHFATAMAKLALVGIAAEQTRTSKYFVELRKSILKKQPSVCLNALIAW